MVNNEDKIQKEMSILENLVGIIRERSKKCDPNIVYPIGEYQTAVDRLFTRYGEFREDHKYKNRFNIIVKDFENYLGDYTYDCICHKKNL
jgi:hypothetical protein